MTTTLKEAGRIVERARAHRGLPEDTPGWALAAIAEHPDGGHVVEFRDGVRLRVVGDQISTYIPRCCDMHNAHCEPPSELCCRNCTEAEHPRHPPGIVCVLG